MKRIVFSVLLFGIVAVSAAFANVFPNAEKIVEDFWTRGSYIKIVRDDDNISYVAKISVAGIEVDEDDIDIAMTGYSVWTGRSGASNASFGTKKYNIESDSEGNIVITQKKKK